MELSFKIQAKTLMELLKVVDKCTNDRNHIAILNNILFDVNGDRLEITGSDVDCSISAVLAVQGNGEKGSFCVNAKRLFDAVKCLPNDVLQFVVSDGDVQLIYSTGVYKLPNEDAADFPRMESPKDEQKILNLPSMVISEGLEKVLFAIGSSELHPQLGGVYFNIHEDSLDMVATDTVILSAYTHTCNAATECSFILPQKASTLLGKLLNDECDVLVAYTPSKVRFVTSAFTLESVLIKGNYPDYNKVMPKEFTYDATVSQPQLKDAIARVSVCAGLSAIARFSFTPMLLSLSAQDIDFRVSALENIDCNCVCTEKLHLSSPKILGALGVMPAADVVLRFNEPNRPVLLAPAQQGEGSEFRVLLMPMQAS